MKALTAGTLAAFLLLAGLVTAPAFADDAGEIDYLLTTIGSSDCTFIRNGQRHDAAAAEAHLRMKYERGKRYATNSESFIERLASRSYLSRKPYQIACADEVHELGPWLTRKLDEYRAHAKVADSDA